MPILKKMSKLQRRRWLEMKPPSPPEGYVERRTRFGNTMMIDGRKITESLALEFAGIDNLPKHHRDYIHAFGMRAYRKAIRSGLLI